MTLLISHHSPSITVQKSFLVGLTLYRVFKTKYNSSKVIAYQVHCAANSSLTVWGSRTGSSISTWRTKIFPCDANHSSLIKPPSRAIGITPARYLPNRRYSYISRESAVIAPQCSHVILRTLCTHQQLSSQNENGSFPQSAGCFVISETIIVQCKECHFYVTLTLTTVDSATQNRWQACRLADFDF